MNFARFLDRVTASARLGRGHHLTVSVSPHRWAGGLRPFPLLAVLAALLLAGPPLAAAEPASCWSGWGYRVEPDTLAFRSQRLLLATDGPVDWTSGNRVTLYPLDPRSGQRAADAAPIVVELRQPSFGHANGNRTMDDVADLVGEPLRLMLGMTRIGPASVADSRQRDFLAWACGRGER